MRGLRGAFGNQAFRQGNQFGAASVHLPDEPAIVKLAYNDPAGRSAQRFHPVARLQVGGFTQALNDFYHPIAFQHSGDAMGDGRRNLTLADRRKIAEQGQSQFPSDGGERVAIEKQKGRLAMEAAELIEAFCERQDLELEGLPVCRARASSFRVNSMLCSTSFARSSIDADDRLPVPVLEKLGSGLKR
jgi:hypothetical protein